MYSGMGIRDRGVSDCGNKKEISRYGGLSMEYKLGDKILCLSSRDLRMRALNLSSNGYGVAVIGFKDIDEHILTITALPEDRPDNIER